MRCLGNTHRRITYVSSFVHHELSLFDTFQDIRSNLLATNAIPVSSLISSGRCLSIVYCSLNNDGASSELLFSGGSAPANFFRGVDFKYN